MGYLKVQGNDESPAVRLEVARAASFFRTADAVTLAREVSRHPQDRFIEYTVAQTMNTLNGLGLGTSGAMTAAAPGGPPPNTPAAALPDLSAAAMRRDLRDKGVQTITIGTVLEQMRYDVRWFVVEAGKPVQVTLTNADAMPHNIVFGQPGSVKTIGDLAATMPPPANLSARAYIPDSPLVLQATRLVQRGESDTIKFTAPTAPGEYSFLCSFPGHYVRMYGVMLVVPSLDAFEARPTSPNDPLTGQPLGSQRQPQY